MKTLKSKLCLILSVLACLCFGIVALVQLTPTNVSAQVEGYTTTDFKMIDKASVRLDAEKNGIRFATFIGDESAEASYDFVNDYELGTLFMPKSLLGEESLELDKDYEGKLPSVAVFDGNVDNLTTDLTYTGGKLFNAVINLTNYTDVEAALNGVMVARTYIKDLATSQVTYLEAVEKAPAYVAAIAIDNEEDDFTGTLTSYVQHVEIVAPANFNLGAWGEAVEGPKTNVEGIPVVYAFSQGKPTQAGLFGGSMLETDLAKVTADNKLEGLGEGDCELTVSAAGGEIVAAVPVTVSFPQVAWFGGEFSPAENYFTIRAKNVASIKFGDQTIDASKWTYTETVDHTDSSYNAERKWAPHEYIIKVKKSDLLGDKITVAGDYAVTIVTNDGFEFDIPVYVRKPLGFTANTDTSNHADIKLMVLEGRLSQFNLAGAYFNESNGLVIPMLGSNYGRFNFNSEYVYAFFGVYTTAEKIEFKWSANNQAGDGVGIPVNYQHWSKTTNKNTGYGTTSTPGGNGWHHVFQGMLYNGTVTYSTGIGDENIKLTWDPGTGTGSKKIETFTLYSAYNSGTYVAYDPAA